MALFTFSLYLHFTRHSFIPTVTASTVPWLTVLSHDWLYRPLTDCTLLWLTVPPPPSVSCHNYRGPGPLSPVNICSGFKQRARTSRLAGVPRRRRWRPEWDAPGARLSWAKHISIEHQVTSQTYFLTHKTILGTPWFLLKQTISTSSFPPNSPNLATVAGQRSINIIALTVNVSSNRWNALGRSARHAATA